MMSFEGHTVLGHETLIRSGSYSLERYWLSGWIYNLKTTGTVEFVFGISGKETRVTIDCIKPVVTFEVV